MKRKFCFGQEAYNCLFSGATPSSLFRSSSQWCLWDHLTFLFFWSGQTLFLVCLVCFACFGAKPDITQPLLWLCTQNSHLASSLGEKLECQDWIWVGHIQGPIHYAITPAPSFSSILIVNVWDLFLKLYF